MTATNHALTGALIGMSVHQPLLAVPAAFASHYVLDALPHGDGFFKLRSKTFSLYLLVEAWLCCLLVLVLAVTQPEYWWLGAICAFVATSPDFMWIKTYLRERKGFKRLKPKLWFVKLHAKVQWFAKPIGAIVELAWAIIAVSLLVIYLKK